MGIINRFLLFVLMIGLALLAVLMLLLCMGAVPEPVWLNELHYILSRRETVAASVVVLVLARARPVTSSCCRMSRAASASRCLPSARWRSRRS